MIVEITLPNNKWGYDESKQLGPEGGFGIVYQGFSKDLGNLAIKKIKVSAQDEAHREIRIANKLLNKEYRNVIPFYDAGYDKNTGQYFIVMPCAEKSLQDEINGLGKIEEASSVLILLEIVSGLLEVKEIIHRDLKPGNVLFHEGKWKIADFGIAKFVEESTSMRTLKGCLSPQYAAPEQWDMESLTNAVDIYSLGCIGIALLTGNPPFLGLQEEIKSQHLYHEPPQLPEISPRLNTLLRSMLRKIPANRPTADAVKSSLSQLSYQSMPSQEFAELSRVASMISEEAARKEAEEIQQTREKIQREKIAKEAKTILNEIISDLFSKIQNYASNALIYSKSGVRSIELGKAKLSVDFSMFNTIPEDAFSRSRWNVITGAVIMVTQELNRPYEWGANLWYTNLGQTGGLNWWEIMYMTSPFLTPRKRFEPYAETDLNLADKAGSNTMDIIQFGSVPKQIDFGNEEEFYKRWVNYLTSAVSGNLSKPGLLPIK
jgi:serine/threonine-protein kinase